jgi:hypothetical protein
MKFIQTLILICFGSLMTFGQELDFEVSIEVPNNIKTDPTVFRSLEQDIREFINTTKFTEDDFQAGEKIKGKLQIIVTQEITNTSFLVDFSLSTSRPVFNTEYVSPMINFYDKGVSINYIPGQNIVRSEATYVDNLSSCLTYYANLSLGFDYDSFASFGGDKYFSAVREVFNNLPANIKNNDPTWINTGVNGRSKYWLIENILSPRLREFRQMSYEYHRLALDNMHIDGDRNRAILLSSLSNIEGLQQSYPNSYLLQLFSDTKYQEIVEIFKVADSGQRNKVRNLMTVTNIGKADRYDALK